MSDTPETDAEAIEVGWGHMMVDADFARKLERERDEWRITASSLKAGEGELLKENAKLCSIAERAIAEVDWHSTSRALELNAELDQLKQEGGE
jgi:hypothetical protein